MSRASLCGRSWRVSRASSCGITSFSPYTFAISKTAEHHMTAAEAEALFLRELPAIDRIIALTCSRSGFRPADAEDLAATLRLKLIDNDYAVIRKFEGKSAFTTYLTVVIQRFMIDQRNERWGRWTPSAEAVRLGPRAVRLEMLLHRDGRPFEDACQLLSSDRELAATRAELATIAERLPRRQPRATTCSIDESSPVMTLASDDSPDARFFARERERAGRIASAVLERCFAQLEPEDRLLLKMRFEDEMSVAQIARATGEEQRRLYYRIDRLALVLRRALEEEGVDRGVARDLLSSGATSLSLTTLGNVDGSPSKEEDRTSAKEAPAE